VSGDRRDLAPLEQIVRAAAAEWGVELGEPFPLARYSYVAPTAGNAVLKVTPPEDDEADQEPEALGLWAGEGAVRLLRRDALRRALLIERAWPGDDIAELGEEEATQVAVATGLRLWRPASNPFRWIGDHGPVGSTRPKGTSSSRWPARCMRRSTSVASCSCTATSTTTTSCILVAGPSRSIRSRCSGSRNSMFRPSSGTRSGTGCVAT